MTQTTNNTAHTSSRLTNLLSLSSFDQSWGETFEDSLLGKIWLQVTKPGASAGNPLRTAGSLLQLAGFLVVLLLTCAVGMRQFASDKEGLALFVLAGLALWVAGRLAGGKERARGNAISAIVLAFLAANVIAACASHYLQASLSGLAKLLVYVASYFLFTCTAGQSKKRMILCTVLLVITGLLVSLYGLYQYKIGVAPLATWEDPTVEVKGTRIYSTLNNPNLLAGYLVPLLPLSFSLAMLAAWSKRTWLAFPALAASGVIALAIILTGSRGGYIGMAGAGAGMVLIVGNWLWREKPKHRLTIIASALVLAVLFILALHFVPTVEQRVISIFAGGEHTSNRYRMNVWLSSFKMFKDSWWFGVGPGNKAFELAYGLYMITGFDALGTYCVPLEFAVEAGILGLAAFGTLVIALLARAHLNFYTTEDGEMRWLIAGASAALFGLMAHGLVDTVFFRPQVQLIFWLVAAMIASASFPLAKKKSECCDDSIARGNNGVQIDPALS
jgi:putative inorganic carbon (HCO3(-)) transporter